MNEEIQKINEWIDDCLSEYDKDLEFIRKKQAKQYISQSCDNWWPEYLKSFKNLHLLDKIEICQTMWTFKYNPILEYVRNHHSEYDLLPLSGYWATGSSSVYVKKTLPTTGSVI